MIEICRDPFGQLEPLVRWADRAPPVVRSGALDAKNQFSLVGGYLHRNACDTALERHGSAGVTSSATV